MTILDEISIKVQKGKADDVVMLCENAIRDGLMPEDILENGLLDGMAKLGVKFRKNEVFVPEVLIASRAISKGIEYITPFIKASCTEKIKGTVILGAVKGDLHDIGKNLVKIMMEAKGLTVIDIGKNVPTEKFIEAAEAYNADIICCSSLLITTMFEMKKIVDAVHTSELDGKVKIMIGGAPVTREFCREIKADYYTDDATEAAEKAYEICFRKNKDSV